MVASPALVRLRRVLAQLLRPVGVEAGENAYLKKKMLADPGDRCGVPGISSKSPYLEPLVLTPANDLPGAEKIGLTPEEVAQFRELGYVVKRGLIPPEELAPFTELWWEAPPVVEAGLRRDDPSTWVAPGGRWPKENRWGTEDTWMGYTKWPVNIGEAANEPRPGGTKGKKVTRNPYNLDCSGHVWRWHGLGHDEAFVRATSAHPNVLHMVEAILGGPVRRPRRNRGLYSVFPRDPEKPLPMGPHHDGAGYGELTAVTYVQPVLPHSGGFTIWPGSYKGFYESSEEALNFVPTEKSEEHLEQVLATVEPREFTGGAGDVIFSVGHNLHSAGIHLGSEVRMAAIMDFERVRERGPLICGAAGKNGGLGAACGRDGVFRLPTDDPRDDPADGEREVTTRWLLDPSEYAKDRSPPKGDMLADWNLGQKPVVGNILDEPPWWEKYNVRIDGPRGGGGMAAVPLSRLATYEGGGAWRMHLRGNDWMEK